MTTPQPGKFPIRRDPERAGITLQILKGLKLKVRLLKDPRISVWLKLGFVAGILWILFPDLVVGPIDDAIVFYFLLNFEDLCPQWVVQDVLGSMEEENKGNRPQDQKKAAPGNSNKERPTGRFLANMGGDPVFFTREEDIPEGVAVWQEIVDRDGRKWRRYR